MFVVTSFYDYRKEVEVIFHGAYLSIESAKESIWNMVKKKSDPLYCMLRLPENFHDNSRYVYLKNDQGHPVEMYKKNIFSNKDLRVYEFCRKCSIPWSQMEKESPDALITQEWLNSHQSFIMEYGQINTDSYEDSHERYKGIFETDYMVYCVSKIDVL